MTEPRAGAGQLTPLLSRPEEGRAARGRGRRSADCEDTEAAKSRTGGNS